MRNKILNGIIFTLFLLLPFSLISILDVKADEFYSQEINVKLNKDGSANFETKIDYLPEKGTEYYIPIENLGTGGISNVEVFELLDGESKKYDFLTDWKVNETIDYKANKYGLVETDNGYEISFGIVIKNKQS